MKLVYSSKSLFSGQAFYNKLFFKMNHFLFKNEILSYEMKICILSLSIIIVVASCVPPGKLTEAIEANNAISKKYDSIQIKLTDTIANFRSSLNELENNFLLYYYVEHI